MPSSIYSLSRIEPLEARIAPAALINPQTVTYTDVDGDLVTVSVSKGDLTGKLTFVTAFNDVGNQQLVSINLTTPQFSGANLTIAVTQAGAGEGYANFGFLNAKGVDLGDVTMGHTSVNKILAGDSKTTTPGLGNISFYNLGGLSIAGATDVQSVINGPVGDINMNVLNEAHLTVVGGAGGTIKSFHASTITGGTAPFSGSVSTTGNMGPVTVGTINGGGGDNSGQILVGGNLGNITSDGLVGNSGKASGTIIVKGSANQMTLFFISGGGNKSGSGSVNVAGGVASIATNTVTGGAGDNSGQIYVGGNLGSMTASTFAGNSGLFSGALVVKGSVNSVSVGSLVGGGGISSGSVNITGNSGSINTTQIVGGAADNSGQVFVGGNLASLATTFGIAGGGGKLSGALIVKGTSGAVTDSNGQILGGTGPQSGVVMVQGVFSGVTTGLITGGAGDHSGAIIAGSSITSIHLRGDLTGSSGTFSGRIQAVGLIGSIVIDGGVKSGTGANSGSIVTNANIGTLTIDGDVTGSAGVSVVISALGNLKPAAGATTNLVLDTLNINGDVKYLNVLAGYDVLGKAFNADAQINAINIAKTVTGSNFVAGVAAGKDGFFGTADDVAIAGGSATIISKIATLVITMQTASTADPSDSFGVVAQQVSLASVNGTPLTLTAGPGNDKGLALGAATDFKLREI